MLVACEIWPSTPTNTYQTGTTPRCTQVHESPLLYLFQINILASVYQAYNVIGPYNEKVLQTEA